MASFGRNLSTLILIFIFLSIIPLVHIYAQTEFVVPMVLEGNMEAENQKQTEEGVQEEKAEEEKEQTEEGTQEEKAEEEKEQTEEGVQEEKAEEEKEQTEEGVQEEKAEEEKEQTEEGVQEEQTEEEKEQTEEGVQEEKTEGEIKEETQQQSCATQEEFCKRIAENDGGTVLLTGDIYWNGRTQNWIRAINETTIVMNGYSIFIEDNASIMLNGPIHFTGSGQNTPLIVLGEQSAFTGEHGVTISATGMASIAVHMTDTRSLIAESVTAEGENCVAVLVESSFEKALPITIKGNIIALGSGAAAIQATGDLQLLNMSLQASGENSAVVRTDGNVYAFFSKVIGEDIIADTSGEIVFDASQVIPEQDNAVFIHRKAVAEPVYISVFSGENYQLPEYVLFNFEVENTEYNGCFASEISSVYRNSLRVQWDISQIDNLSAGIYTATAMPLEYTEFDSISFEPIEGSVEIIKELPQIERVFYVFQDLVLQINVQIPKGIPCEVRYKTDNENEWEIYGRVKLDESQSSIALLDFGKAMGPEEQKITFSIRFLHPTEYRETAEFQFIGHPPKNDGGGDRDGGDQNDQGDRENSGNETSVKLEEEKGETLKNKEMADKMLKIYLSDIFRSLERTFQQISQKWKETALHKEFSTEFEETGEKEVLEKETAEKEATENETVLLKPETVQMDRNKEANSSEEGTNDRNEKTEGKEESIQKQKKAVPMNLDIDSEDINMDISTLSDSIQKTVLTGAEISRLIQTNPRFLTFVENNIRLLIPTKAVEQLDLSEYETFQVELLQTEQAFSIQIYINGIEKTDWAEYPLQVYLKGDFIDEEWEAIYCYINGENYIEAEGVENDAIVFHIVQTGEYKIVIPEEKKENITDENKEQQKNTQSKENEKINKTIVFFVMFIFFVSGILYWLCHWIKR